MGPEQKSPEIEGHIMIKPVHTIAVLTLATAIAGGANASMQTFRLTLTDTGPQPLSPLFYSAGNNQFNIFSVGAGASNGIKKIAEGGDTSGLLAEAAGAAPGSLASYGVLGNAPLAPGHSESILFTADSDHPYLSFAAMLGKTNDGFIGESVNSMSLNLFNGSTPRSFTYNVTGARAWDAGTELNTQNAADLGFRGGSGNPSEDPSMAFIHVHPGIIAGVGDSWQLMPNWTQGTNLATVSVQSVPEPAPMLILSLLAAGTLFLKARGA